MFSFVFFRPTRHFARYTPPLVIDPCASAMPGAGETPPTPDGRIFFNYGTICWPSTVSALSRNRFETGAKLGGKSASEEFDNEGSKARPEPGKPTNSRPRDAEGKKPQVAPSLVSRAAFVVVDVGPRAGSSASALKCAFLRFTPRK